MVQEDLCQQSGLNAIVIDTLFLDTKSFTTTASLQNVFDSSLSKDVYFKSFCYCYVMTRSIHYVKENYRSAWQPNFSDLEQDHTLANKF